MRKLYWYTTAYIRKHGTVVILSLVAAILVFSFTMHAMVSTLEKGDRYYIGLIGEYSLTSLPPTVAKQISSGLTEVQVDGSVLPKLSERWTVEHEGKTYRFLLKQNIVWQDGKPLTPEDVKYSFKEVETIITPNDIVFKLPDTFAPFPISVSEPIIRLEQAPHKVFFKRQMPVGIGKYRVVDYTRQGQKLTELVVDGPNERYVYRFYLTEDEAVRAFKQGEVDTLPDLAKQHDIMEWPTTETSISLKQNQYVALFFNIRSPLFQKNVRQAFSYALEKPQGDDRASGPISPTSWAYLEGGKLYERDWERATERMLAEIPSEPLTIELTTTSLFEHDAEQIKSELEAFGQHVYGECQSSSDVEDKTRCENVKIAISIRVSNFPDTSNFQLLLIGQESPADPDQYHLWHSEQGTNFTGYKNTRIDNLLEKGRQTMSEQERVAIYQEFQQFFLEDAPAVFLRHLQSYSVSRTTPAIF